MSQPVQDLRDIGQLGPLRHHRTVDHQHRKAQCTRGVQLGARSGAACVLGHNQLRPVAQHQRPVVFDRERSTRNEDVAIGQRHGLGLIHQPQQIVVLGLSGEVQKMHTANGQKHAPSRTGQRVNRTLDIRYMLPIVTLLRDPSRSGQRSQRSRCRNAGFDRIAAHLRGKGVGRVYDMADPMFADVTRQPLRSSEASDARWYRLRAGAVHPASIGIGGRDALLGDGFYQSIRLGRTTKNQEVGHV